MRLRHKLLALFGVCAIVPLLAIGVFDYVHSIRAVDALVRAQAGTFAGRAAAALRSRLDLQESDIALISENEETQRTLRSIAAGDSASAADEAVVLDRYLAELWQTARVAYEELTLRDAKGRVVVTFGEPATIPPARGTGGPPTPPTQVRTRITRTIADLGHGTRLGELELSPRLGELFRDAALRERFGERGRTFVVDRSDGRVLFDGGNQAPGLASGLPSHASEGGTGSTVYRENGERRAAAWVALSSPAPEWMVVSTASVDEFAGPFVRQRLFDLGFLLVIVVLVSMGFVFLLLRATRSLDVVTAAADRVGRGDLSPALPPAGKDEVGRLAEAFGVMTTRIREMLAHVEASRQTAVLGRFAAELAHEIRNPLTSIKLNLQGLERDGREGHLTEESRAAVAMALREIRRLDQALRTALRAGRPVAEARPYRLGVILDEAIAVVTPEATAQHVRIESHQSATESGLLGDPEGMKGALVNVLLNAIQSMPGSSGGGTVHATTANVPFEGTVQAIEVRIRDEGPGIPADLRERVFRPFFTTREGGTGLGLSVALQTVHAHGGRLQLGDGPGRGTEVIITLPLVEGVAT